MILKNVLFCNSMEHWITTLHNPLKNTMTYVLSYSWIATIVAVVSFLSIHVKLIKYLHAFVVTPISYSCKFYICCYDDHIYYLRAVYALRNDLMVVHKIIDVC